jgi:transcriptional regulator GlxA family with amidase domain
VPGAVCVIHGFWKNHAGGQVLKAQRWMEENYSQKVSIDDLARDLGISPRQFARRFKHATGETPVAYLQHLRIENAKKRLETTLDTVNEITWHVGYEDINSFRRLFIKHTGLAPREFRNKFARPVHERAV